MSSSVPALVALAAVLIAGCKRASRPPTVPLAELVRLAADYVSLAETWDHPPGPPDHDGDDLGHDPMEYARYHDGALEVVRLGRDVAAAMMAAHQPARAADLTGATDALARSIQQAPDDSLADVEAHVAGVLAAVREHLDGSVASPGPSAARCVLARVGVAETVRAHAAAIDEAGFRSERDLHETGLPPGDPEQEEAERAQAALVDILDGWSAWLRGDALRALSEPVVAAAPAVPAAPALLPDEIVESGRGLRLAIDRAGAVCRGQPVR